MVFYTNVGRQQTLVGTLYLSECFIHGTSLLWCVYYVYWVGK